MKFIALAFAALAAGVSAHTSAAEQCSIVTVTETVTYGTTIPVPGTSAPTQPPYPISSPAAPYPIPSGTGAPPAQGTAAPSGTGSYTPAPPSFTGAAGTVNVAGALAGVGAVAALFL